MTQQYSAEHYNLLLGHIVRTPGFRARALKHIQAQFFAHPDLIANGAHMAHGLLFDILSRYIQAFGTPPDPAALYAEAKVQLERVKLGAEAQSIMNFIGEFMSWVPHMAEGSLKQAEDILAYIVDTCVFKKTEEEILDLARESRTTSEMIDRLRHVNNQRLALTTGTVRRGVCSIDVHLMDSAVRVPTGVGFIDERLGGGRGPVGSCALGILAGQGSGKTTFGVQICTNKAITGVPALLVLVEEGLSPRMLRQIRSAALGIPTPIQEECEDRILEAAGKAGLDLATVALKVDLLDKNLDILDLIENPGGLELLEAKIEQMAAEGRKPQVVYVDWAGIWATYMIANPPTGMKFEGPLYALKYLSQQLSSLAARANIQIWISHQMAPANCQLHAWNVNDQYCAADCRGFTEPFQYVFVINKRARVASTDTQLQLLHIAKARGDQPNQTAVIRHMGAISVFEEATGFHQVGKSFQAKSGSSPKSNALPSESSPKRNNTVTE